jgi:membrane-bound ClpP family serine protease
MTEENTQEKKGHFLDLKVPLGGLLSFYGAVLVIFGLFSKKEIYTRSLGFNVNLFWGIFILVVGLALLLTALAKRRRQGSRPL